MALLVRTRPAPEPRAEPRAEPLPELLPELLAEPLAAVAQRGAELVDRAGETAQHVREVAVPAVERAREVTTSTAATAATRIAGLLGRLLRLVIRLAAIVPGLGARVLQTVSQVLARLADRSAEIAHVEPPTRAGRRHRRRRAGLWFATGFVTGAAAGYAANEVLSSRGAMDGGTDVPAVATDRPVPSEAVRRPAHG